MTHQEFDKTVVLIVVAALTASLLAVAPLVGLFIPAVTTVGIILTIVALTV